MAAPAIDIFCMPWRQGFRCCTSALAPATAAAGRKAHERLLWTGCDPLAGWLLLLLLLLTAGQTLLGVA